MVDPRRQITHSRSVCTLKILRIVNAFSRHKNMKNGSRATNKEQTSNPKFIKNDFCVKLIFAIPTLRKPEFRLPSAESPIQKSIKNVTQKQARNKMKLQVSSSQKANVHGSQNHTKIYENHVPDRVVPGS